MKYEYEHREIQANEFQETLDKLYELSKERGFSKQNSLFVTVHSTPGESPTVTQLMYQIHEFLKPGKFEMIGFGEYLENGNMRVSVNEDYRSTTHVHLLIKCSYFELKSYLIKWNKRGVIPGNKLFQAEPIASTIYDSIQYKLKGLYKKRGLVVEPSLAFLKRKKERTSVDWFWRAVTAVSLLFSNMRKVMCNYILTLSVLFTMQPISDSLSLYVIGGYSIGLPNGPPVTFLF